MTNARQALRELLAADELVVVPEALNAAGARLVEMAGHKAVYCGGYALSGAEFAMPDHGLITTTEMIELASRIADAVQIPLIVDADQGGETALNVYRTVRKLGLAGIAGVHIEDTRNPKHMSLLGEAARPDMLQPIEEMCSRISAAVDARIDDDFLVIARTDEMFNKGSLDITIERGIAYAAAGADAYFVCSLPMEFMDRVATEVPIPIMDINHPIPMARRSKLKLDIFTGHSLPAMLWAAQACLDDLKRDGEVNFAARQAAGFADLVQDSVFRSIFAHWAAAASYRYK